MQLWIDMLYREKQTIVVSNILETIWRNKSLEAHKTIVHNQKNSRDSVPARHYRAQQNVPEQKSKYHGNI